MRLKFVGNDYNDYLFCSWDSELTSDGSLYLSNFWRDG